MPLDGHSYLVSQGWGGKGTGLRQGAISRPIAVSQKKNLAGLGKDRDEAFPFWDHLFSAAASAIKVSIDDSDDESNSGNGEDQKEKPTTVSLKLTQTGIISNRRPVNGTPADSSETGASTPDTTQPADDKPRYSLLTVAKRDAARRGLYSRFFKGPVLGPETVLEKTVKESSPNPTYAVDKAGLEGVGNIMKQEASSAKDVSGEETDGSLEEENKGKTVKAGEKDRDILVVDDDSVEEKRRRKQEKERKKAKREKKRRKEEEEEEIKKEKKKRKEKRSADENTTLNSKGKQKDANEDDGPLSQEKKKRNSRKSDSSSKVDDQSDPKKSKKSKRLRLDEDDEPSIDTSTPPKKKKKRKHEMNP